MRSIEQHVDGILQHLTRMEMPVVHLMQDGLPRNEIQDRLGREGFMLPVEAQRIYACKNGTRVQEGDLLDELHFFPGFYLMSLEDAIASYKAFQVDDRWDQSWYPIFANGGGDFYAIVCSQEETDSGPVLGFIIGEHQQDIEYESLTTMLETIEACYDQGVFYLSDKGHLDADDLAQAQIAKRCNPSIDLYNELE